MQGFKQALEKPRRLKANCGSLYAGRTRRAGAPSGDALRWAGPSVQGVAEGSREHGHFEEAGKIS